MYARVVRFTDVDPDHLAGRLDEVEASEGPPVDIPAKGLQILHDPDQRTAVVIQLFETADDMSAAVRRGCAAPVPVAAFGYLVIAVVAVFRTRGDSTAASAPA